MRKYKVIADILSSHGRSLFARRGQEPVPSRIRRSVCAGGCLRLRGRFSSSLVALTAVLASPVAAQEDTQTDQQREIQRLQDELELVKARNDLAAARNEGLQAQIDALGLPETEGKTTLEGEGGKLEGWMLATATLTEAAKAINDRVTAAMKIDESVAQEPKKKDPESKTKAVLLLDGDDIIDLRVSQLLKNDIDVLVAAHRKVGAEVTASGYGVTCKPLIGDGQDRKAVIDGASAPLVGLVMSLLKTDTTISGFALETPDGALLNAIVGFAPGRYILPADLVAPGTSGSSLTALKGLVGLNESARVCRNAIAKDATTNAKKKKAASVLASLDALATRTQGFLDAVSARKDGKPSRLETAMVADVLNSDIANTRILRVHTEKAGGSILKRSNIFTMLGAPAIGITGGAVISWRLSNPESGKSLGGGILVCRTKLTNMNAIHAGRVKIEASSCSTNLSAPS